MYSQLVPATFKVTMASLGPDVEPSADSRTTVMLRMEDQDDYALCSLTPGKLEQQPLDLMLKTGENIALRVSGPCAIHLTGYYVHEHEHDDFIDDEEEGECEDCDMAEEVDGEYDSEEEDEFDSDEAKKMVKKIMKSKRARRAQIESSTEEDEEVSEIETDGESTGSHDEDEEDEEIDSEDIDSEDLEDMSEVDFDSEELDDANEESEESEKEVIPKGKRSNVSEKKHEQPEAKKVKTESAPAKPSHTPEPAKPVAVPAKKESPAKPAAPAAAGEEQVKAQQPAKQEQQPSKKPVVKTLPSGLVIEDILVGSGQKVNPNHRVGISYTGKLQNGKIFDKSKGQDLLYFTVGRGEVIKGMDMGIQGMCVGGKRKLTIPAPLAYGGQSQPGIPANSTLIFEICAEKIKQGKN